MTVLVFDVGGTEVKYSVIDENIKPRDCGSFPTFKATVVPCTFLNEANQIGAYYLFSGDVIG